MSLNPEDKLDWWNDGAKGERKAKTKAAAKPKESKTTKERKTTKPKEADKRRRPLLFRLGLHFVLVAVAIVLMSVVAHYVLLSITRHNAHTTVPRFESMLIEDAQQMAEERGLVVVVSDSVYAPIYDGGAVLEQNPAPGVEVKPGRAIYVIINALQREMVTIPYVSGRSLRQARNMLEVAGLKIGKLIYEPDLATNYVLAQRYQDGEIMEGSTLRAPRGSSIVLHVGVNAGDEVVMVPQLIGRSLYEAQSVLLESGLNVGDITRSEGVTLENEKLAHVMYQSISGESEASLGDHVSFTITLDSDQVNNALADFETARKQEQLLLDSIRLAEMPEEIVEEVKTNKNGDSGFKDLFD